MSDHQRLARELAKERRRRYWDMEECVREMQHQMAELRKLAMGRARTESGVNSVKLTKIPVLQEWVSLDGTGFYTGDGIHQDRKLRHWRWGSFSYHRPVGQLFQHSRTPSPSQGIFGGTRQPGGCCSGSTGPHYFRCLFSYSLEVFKILIFLEAAS